MRARVFRLGRWMMLELVTDDAEDMEPQGVGHEDDAQVWSFSF